MSIKISSFHITDMIYDAENKSLTYKFMADGVSRKRVAFGTSTAEEIASDFQEVISDNFAEL